MGDYRKLRGRPKIKKIKAVGENQLKIVWTAVEGAERYGVYRKEKVDGEFKRIKWKKKRSFIDNVERDKTYWYKIVAHKTLDGKKKSTKDSGIRAAIISDIKPVGNLTAQPEKNKVKLFWDKNEDASKYIVYRRNDFFSQMLPVAQVEKPTFEDEKVVSGQVYHYCVQCVYENDEIVKQGKFSKKAHCVCLDCGEILSAKVSGRKVSFSLRLVAGADGYILERSNGKTGEFSEVARTKSNLNMAVSDKAPNHFKTYFYRVRSYKTIKDKEFISEPCSEITVKTK